jgi:hypothetical protein
LPAALLAPSPRLMANSSPSYQRVSLQDLRWTYAGQARALAFAAAGVAHCAGGAAVGIGAGGRSPAVAADRAHVGRALGASALLLTALAWLLLLLVVLLVTLLLLLLLVTLVRRLLAVAGVLLVVDCLLAIGRPVGAILGQGGHLTRRRRRRRESEVLEGVMEVLVLVGRGWVHRGRAERGTAEQRRRRDRRRSLSTVKEDDRE